MKETGIIMSGNHPRLILDGIKTMTRRVLRKQPLDILPMNAPSEWIGLMSRDPSKAIVFKCRYGQVGDRLWVRETLEKRNDGYAIYAADKEQVLIGGDGINEGVSWEWKKDTLNGMFMPRWASRITLEITEVRAELLRDISEADAKAEGGYTIEEFIRLYLKINHLPEDANPQNWVIGW